MVEKWIERGWKGIKRRINEEGKRVEKREGEKEREGEGRKKKKRERRERMKRKKEEERGVRAAFLSRIRTDVTDYSLSRPICQTVRRTRSQALYREIKWPVARVRDRGTF